MKFFNLKIIAAVITVCFTAVSAGLFKTGAVSVETPQILTLCLPSASLEDSDAGIKITADKVYEWYDNKYQPYIYTTYNASLTFDRAVVIFTLRGEEEKISLNAGETFRFAEHLRYDKSGHQVTTVFIDFDNDNKVISDSVDYEPSSEYDNKTRRFYFCALEENSQPALSDPCPILELVPGSGVTAEPRLYITPLNLAVKTNVISSTTDGSTALKADGSVWSLNTGGMVIDSGIKAVSGGSAQTFALKENGELLGLGYRDHRLGIGVAERGQSQETPVHITDGVAMISTGTWHSMAVKNDGSLWAWGDNGTFRYGNHIGGGDWMVYDAEYDSPAPIHIMNGIVSVSAGEYQTSAIKDNGELWTWGSMLGVGAVNHETRRGYGDDPYKMMDGVKAVSAGHGHHAAVKTNGEVWTWGANNAGQLGCGDTENRYFFPNYAVKAMDGVMTVSAGAAHTLALTANGGLWAWGSNAYGQIGDGTYENRLTPVKVMDNVAAIATGKNHSLAVTKDGVLLAWGDNHIRQLGADSGDNSPVPVWVMDGMMIPEPEITVLLDGKQLFFDQTPVIEDGRTLVPLRKIFEALGAVVDWQDETQTVTAEKDGKKVSLTIGDKSASVDGKTVTLDVPAKIANGRTLVPARFVAESLGCAVDWDNDLQTVLITG